MIRTFKVTSIDAEALKDWLEKALAEHYPEGTQFYLIPKPWDAKGESRFFCEIEVEEDITIEGLIAREVKEHSRGQYVHFYAYDVVCAAALAGEFEGRGNYFHLYYRW
jgi:hypothetical protein